MVGSEGGYLRRDSRWQKHDYRGSGDLKIKEESTDIEKLRQLTGEQQLTYRSWCKWAASLQAAQLYLPLKVYQYRLERYVYPVIGEVPLQTLDRFMLIHLIKDWQRGEVDYRQMEELTSLLNKTLDYAVNLGVILENPCDNSLQRMLRIKMEALSLSEKGAVASLPAGFPAGGIAVLS